ncbi:MAG: ElyC/SanA/YdcF family protein [Candidatus Omnitrophica bacterium]|nr:ElyC/SanA/YdcF family protein [Candidatus Omnitrophota bacterium]MDD5591854.1 ElyC/SanA/YdcF family protein [Candidatus Omnitrophota bacterium]
MLKNHNIICISSIDWDFVWQGHQEIMSIFTKNGNKVLFIENTGVRSPKFRDIPRLRKRIINWFKGTRGFRNEMENLYIFSPVILPFQYSLFARWINKHLLLKPLKKWKDIVDFHAPIIWTFLPTGIALDIINSIEKKLLVYYCIADFYKLVNNPKNLKKTEDELIKMCDLVFVQGPVLAEKCRSLNNNVYVFPFGVNINIFNSEKELPAGYNYVDIKNIKKPIIGYIGGIHRHINFNLLMYVAKANPDWSFVLVGPIQTDVSSLRGIPNIIFLGQKDFHLLPGYIKEFDVCIIPYLKSEYTNTVYPTKLNEYHAFGKPVVSTDIPEIMAFNRENGNLVLIARTKEEFIKKINNALEERDSNLISERIRLAKGHSWDKRIEEMSNLIEGAIRKKEITGYSDWQEIFKRIYRTARRRFLGSAFIFLALWLLIFYTPVIWYLAEPLKIVNKPQKADAIVVLGGGVGESGKAGQGYEERVDYAVKLYNEGYAGHLIFSTGYGYVFKEAQLMKSLAISLGVPNEAIVLEENSANTYENIKFVEEILLKRNWKKVLLISSPYHMRRAALVIRKNAPGITVIYTPIKSRFYSHDISPAKKISKRIDLKQIKGIIHEYLAIAYYWWKGGL